MSEVIAVIPEDQPETKAVSFQNGLAQWLDSEAVLTETVDGSSPSPGALAAGRAIRHLADFVRNLHPRDQRLTTISEAQTIQTGASGTVEFVPGRGVHKLVALVGRNLEQPPQTEALFHELVRYAARDLRQSLTGQTALRAEQQIAAAREEIEARTAREVLRAQDAESEALGKFHFAEAEITDLRAKYSHLRARMGDEDSEPEKPKAKKRPKTKVTA